MLTFQGLLAKKEDGKDNVWAATIQEGGREKK